jgi:hypothetical protein
MAWLHAFTILPLAAQISGTCSHVGGMSHSKPKVRPVASRWKAFIAPRCAPVTRYHQNRQQQTIFVMHIKRKQVLELLLGKYDEPFTRRAVVVELEVLKRLFFYIAALFAPFEH